MIYALTIALSLIGSVNHHWRYAGQTGDVHRWEWIATVDGNHHADRLFAWLAVSNQHDLSTVDIEVFYFPESSVTLTDMGAFTEIEVTGSGEIWLGEEVADFVLVTVETTAAAADGFGYTALGGGEPAWISGPLNDGTLLTITFDCGSIDAFNSHLCSYVTEPGYSVAADIDQDQDVDFRDRGYVLGSLSGWCAGDANMDGTVDSADVSLVLSQWGYIVQDGFCPGADLNGDGRISQADLALVLMHYGEGE